jgi:hypothetical protein
MRGIVGAASLTIVLVLAACNSAPSRSPGLVTIAVDPSLDPAAPSLPELGGEPRPVAVLETDDGERAEFVANELWVSTPDRAALDALLDRWDGEVLLEIDPVASGVGGLDPQYLVRIDVARADASGLSDDLASLLSDATGSASVSSDEGLGLLAAAAGEATAGGAVGVNWIGSGGQLAPQDVRDRTLAEAPSGPSLGGTGYDPNPFAWPTHDVGSPQDIGVAEAWRALDLAGRLEPGIDVAILDMGFQPDDDTPDDYIAISKVPFMAPTGSENLLDCGGPCPWHGTNVMSAAFALPDNGYGSAGPGGPVAEPILVYTLYDFFTSITALMDARLLGADIANMSYGAPVPDYLSWSVLPFETATAALRATGMLLFAAAGNDGKNVDAERTAFGVGLGFEKTWWTPCENAGVICVGGLFTNSLSRASGSNYGSEQVDLFAPYTLWLGPDPSAPDNAVRAMNGTSFSSPFAAGVAALIWAADPTLSAGEVEDILLDTAKPSPDDQVGRVVDALGAVQEALGNVAPAIEVLRPDPGDEIQLNLAITLDAVVEDFEDGTNCCEVAWRSDVDGALGDGRFVQTSFATLGPRTLTVEAVDSQGARSSASVDVTVVNSAPTVEITKPLAGDDVFQGVPVVLRGSSFDLNEPGTSLDCASLAWTSDGFTSTLQGCEVEATFPALGSWTLTLTGTDPQGASATASVDVAVQEPPPDLPPTVRITNPENLEIVGRSEEIVLTADVADPEGQTPVTLTWTVSLNGLPEIQVGTGNNVPWTPSDTYDFSEENLYVVTITATAEDPSGNTASDFVQLEWRVIN